MRFYLLIAALALGGCASTPKHAPAPKNPAPPIAAVFDSFLDEKTWRPRYVWLPSERAGSAITGAGYRHVLAALSREKIGDEERIRAWRKYCYNRQDMTEQDWRVIRNSIMPEALAGRCDPRPLVK